MTSMQKTMILPACLGILLVGIVMIPGVFAAGGCGEGTVLVNGVCQLSGSSGTSIPPLYIAGGAAAIGAAIIGIIFAVRRGSSETKTPKPAKKELEEYEEKYLAKQKPSPKPAKKKETSSSCNNCGKPLKPKAKFCGGCGTPRS